MQYPIEARCQCGQTGYSLKKPPLKVLACHCQECQKIATGPISVTALVKAEDVDFIGEMSAWERSSDSGNINAARFCPGCGNRIYHFNPADTSILKLKLKPTGMDDDSVFAPEIQVWTCEKLSWFDGVVDLPGMEKQP